MNLIEDYLFYSPVRSPIQLIFQKWCYYTPWCENESPNKLPKIPKSSVKLFTDKFFDSSPFQSPITTPFKDSQYKLSNDESTPTNFHQRLEQCILSADESTIKQNDNNLLKEDVQVHQGMINVLYI